LLNPNHTNVLYDTFSICGDFVSLLIESRMLHTGRVCSRVLRDKEEALKAALETATTIASKSPVVVQGTKISLVYSRDHSVPDSLQQVVCTYFAYYYYTRLTAFFQDNWVSWYQKGKTMPGFK